MFLNESLNLFFQLVTIIHLMTLYLMILRTSIRIKPHNSRHGSWQRWKFTSVQGFTLYFFMARVCRYEVLSGSFIMLESRSISYKRGVVNVIVVIYQGCWKFIPLRLYPFLCITLPALDISLGLCHELCFWGKL